MDITFSGCELKGWLSGHGSSHTFTNCSFGKSGDYQNYVPYCNAIFNGCAFDEGFTISLAVATQYTFDSNCKVGSTTIITSPANLKWDFSGDGSGSGDKTVTIGNASWKTSMTKENWTENTAIDWVENTNQ